MYVRSVGVFLSSILMLLTVMLACPLAKAQTTHAEADPRFEFDTNDPEAVPVSDDRLNQVMRVYEADQTLQRERPEYEPEAQPQRQRDRASGPGPIARAIAAFFKAVGSVLGYILLILVILAVLAGIYMVFGDAVTWRGRQKEKTAEPDISAIPNLRPEQARAQALLGDADALAAEGRFAEAVHLLLFRSIDEIQEKRAGAIARSLTSREIGALGILPDPVRQALSPIIRIVERSFFGGRDVDETGWQQARASYETFAFGETWG